ncbi:MAG: PGF-pre-PGF domain-containing protein [Candidatus Nanohaloarchaea archaeon]
MRKLSSVIAVALLVAPAMAVEASIQPSSPSAIVFNGSNNYQVSKTFDGSASTGDITDYTWHLLKSDQSDTGPSATFDFTRQDSQTRTVRLMVSNGSASDMAEVTQVLHDRPNITVSWPDDDLYFGGNSNDDGNDDNSIMLDFSVEATDRFDGSLSYSWEVEGTEEDTGSSFSYSFQESDDKEQDVNFGTDYTVTVNVTDGSGYFRSDSDTITVYNKSEGSGSSNTQTQQTQKTQTTGLNTQSSSVYDYQRSVVGTADEPAEVSLPTPLNQIRIESNGVIAGDLNVDTPEDNPAPEQPPGKAYRYYGIEPNITGEQITSVTFSFMVEKDWISDNDIKRSTVALQRYNGEWETLDTSETSENSSHVMYEATSSGFSSFVITGEQEGSSKITVQQVQIASGNISAGEQFTVEVQVENTGSKRGPGTVKLSVGNQTLSRDVSLNAGEGTKLEFTSSLPEGTYTVTAGSKSAQVEVASSGGQQDQKSSGVPVFWIAGLVLLVSAGAAGAIVYTGREEKVLSYIEDIERRVSGLAGGTGFSFDSFGGEEDLDADWDDDGFDYSFNDRR